jgi:hypothetical protein
MRERLTPSEYRRVTSTPARRFKTISISKTRISLRNPVSAPSYWFEKHDVSEDGDTGHYWRDTNLASIDLVVDGKTSAIFYLAGSRLDTCTFAYDLTPSQLAKAVSAMRRAKLQRLIRPAAQWALREMPAERRAVLEPPLRELLGRSAKKRAS